MPNGLDARMAPTGHGLANILKDTWFIADRSSSDTDLFHEVPFRIQWRFAITPLQGIQEKTMNK